MKPASRLFIGYCALGALTAATIFTSIYYRFAAEGAEVRSWLLPLCLATAGIAWAVGRMREREVAETASQSSRVSSAA